MSLRGKIVLVILVVVAVHGAMDYANQHFSILPSYEELERVSAIKDIERCKEAIRQRISSIDLLAYDWSAWDDTYDFIENPNSEYIDSNLPDSTFFSTPLNMIFLCDNEGSVVWGRIFDLDSEEEIQLAEFPSTAMPPDHPLLQHTDVESAITGLMVVGERLMMVASRPIITSDEEGPIRGALIMGRFIEAETVATLEDQLLISLKARSVFDSSLSSQDQAAIEQINLGSQYFLDKTSKTNLEGYAVLPDISGKPALLIHITNLRDIMQKGWEITLHSQQSLFVILLISLIPIWLFIDRVIVSRLRKLERFIAGLGESGNVATSTNIVGRDEIGQLGHEVNEMLGRLRHADKELQDSEGRYRHLFDSMGEGIVTIDILDSGRFSMANPAAEKLFGVGSGELIGEALEDYCDPSGLIDVRNQLGIRRQGRNSTYEWELVRADGTRRNVQVTASPRFNDANEFIGSFSLLVDITERKQAEKELLESEERYKLLSSMTSDYATSVRVDPDGVLTNEWVVGSFEEITGMSYKFDVPTSSSGVHRDDIEAFQRAIDQTLDNHPTTSEYRLILEDESMIWLRVNRRPEWDEEQGRVVRFVAVAQDITERKLEEEKRHLGEKHLNQAQEIAHIGNWEYNRQTDERVWSDELFRIFGLEPATTPPSHEVETSIVHPDDRYKFNEISHMLSSSNLKDTVEYRIIRPCGNERTLLDMMECVLDENGNVMKVFGVVQDITEQKLVEAAMMESEERYRLLIENQNDLIVKVDTEGNFQFVSPSYCTLFGKSEEELLGNAFMPLVHEDDRESAVEEMKKLQFAPHTVYIEQRAMTKDGWRWLGWMDTAVLDEDGVVTAVIGVGRDITERKQTEEQLNRLSTAIQQAAETVVITDTEGAIQYVNPAFCKTTGYSEEEVIGQNPRILQSDRHDDEFFKDMWNTLSDGKPWHGRFVNRKKDSTIFHEDATITPIFDNKKQIINYVAVKRDVTQEVSLETQLRQTQKMEAIGTLAGGIAHDFNNVLFAILGYADLAADDIPPSHPANACLDQITIAAKRAAELVKQILTFSRRGEKRKMAINVVSIAKEVVKMLRASMPTTIGINLRIKTATTNINADPTQIHQVIMNLCTNASHAMMENGGELEVELSTIEVDDLVIMQNPDLQKGSYLILSVSDTGPGIPPEIIDKVFDPFFTTKGVGEGTGMGLAVVHGIILDLEGTIKVSSEAGKGTTFKLFIPLADADAYSAEAAQKAIPGGNERVLIVDDEIAIVNMVADMLNSLGYTVTPFSSSQEALAAYQSAPDDFDIVITDQTMGGLTGGELSRNILEIQPQQPIILVTGFSHIMSREKADQLGISAYLTKPVSKKNLAEVVRHTLDRK